jgi:hypothetical protein
MNVLSTHFKQDTKKLSANKNATFLDIFRFEVMYQDSMPLDNLSYILTNLYLDDLGKDHFSYGIAKFLQYYNFLNIFKKSGSFSNLLYRCASHALKSLICLV